MNYDGNSGSMETEASKRLWARSRDLGFKYVTMISDGDSSAYKTLAAMNDNRGPYNDNSFNKEECLAHACKRLGTRLRKLKKDASTLSYTKKGKIRKKSLLGHKK